ncbi:HAMP domain-containing sensor histidine kinase [Denitratisoma sp. agr-D3]
MDDLIAATLHDAKNGLNALMAWLDQARSSVSAPALEQAQRQVERINAQLVELLALYREDRGILRLAIADHDLLDFLDDMKSEWLSPPDTTVTIQWPDSSPVPVWAFDAYQVKLVLFDALRNALRHAKQTIALRIEKDAEGGLRFVVADDGPGFAENNLVKAMDAAGSGLGLSFARIIAEHHRTPSGKTGRIEMQNAPQGGALFSLLLP